MIRVARKRKQKTIPNPYNIGFIDRSLRYIVGGIMLGSVFYLSTETTVTLMGYEIVLMKLLALLSIYPLVTAWYGRDPVYHALSIKSDTNLKEDKCSDIVDQIKTATHLDS